MLFISQTALELGFVYSLVSMALYLSYRVLDIADLTTDGSFVLGMAVSVSFAAKGHPLPGLFAAMLAGSLAGSVTAVLQTKLGVPSILAGIITNTGLYTVNLFAMGWSSNINLLKQETIFTIFRETGIGGKWYEFILISFIVIIAGTILTWFLSTRLGLSVRATGDNREMVSASSINPSVTITIGLCIANALTALSGAVVGQLQKSADINGGTGIVVIGLACLIIGETVLGRKGVGRSVISVVIGSIIYRFIYAIVLKTAILPIECLKLVTSVVVASAIASPTIKNNIHLVKMKKEAVKRSRI
ncbi:MAG: ABC transporter permease [Eubacteriaceae bacterium]|nr:ABC transporter permease [Eubacteriaceae bacterium]